MRSQTVIIHLTMEEFMRVTTIPIINNKKEEKRILQNIGKKQKKAKLDPSSFNRYKRGQSVQAGHVRSGHSFH